MEITKLIADFNQLYFDLQSHPYLIDFPEKAEEFHNLYFQLLGSISDYSSFLDSLTALTCFFHDGHTNIELPYRSTDLCIPIRCSWHHERLIVTEDYGAIPQGAALTEIEGLPMFMVVKRLLHRIPHENIFLVKSRLTEYPYRNYHLFSDLNLAAVFGEKKEYSLSYQHDGQSNQISLPLVPYDGFLDFSDHNFLSWYIADGHAHLKLNACICDDSYVNALQDLAQACSENNATTLTLDLSHNMGGTSEVIEKFLEYVDIDSFHRYEMIDYSTGKPACICSRSETVTNQKQKFLFPKNIICKLGNTTFSSARTFAVTLYDNHIATLEGEPTGGKPSSYGMPRKCTLQNSGIRFRVSHAWFGRPNPGLDSDATLAPKSCFLL